MWVMQVGCFLNGGSGEERTDARRRARSNNRLSSIDIQTKVLVALNFFATGSYQTSVGRLDCTHIAIVSPSKNLDLVENRYPEYMYVNLKSYHSINVQLVCDSNLKVLNVNVLFPGSTNDVHIWNNSNVSNMLEELHTHNYSDYFLLGDSGYPLRPWLLTPIAQPTTAAEENYNKNQMHVRSVIERCNRVLKMRFR
ncbi:unnamed protein product [Macrosiphum euphorbiae]|uniref:DDE Tnp4 domain-containing protein n=1 Tax=Macrosiphum euphorbiae TaxID=13131 RepID=A0AAV0XYP4_9HEMI|nr:unnamed protein product [Macrosiphum euphorbiae]